MAAPHVAGAIALLLDKYPNKTALEIKNLLLQNTTPLPSLEGKLVTEGKLALDKLFKEENLRNEIKSTKHHNGLAN